MTPASSRCASKKLPRYERTGRWPMQYHYLLLLVIGDKITC